ncbi:MAG: altronate dehydratase [Clostridia bacterium]|nr:altronate dehydratase [Clostridia bacterium]
MLLHPADNVEVRADGHKYALRAIRAGENIIKYGEPIGHATAKIAAGEWVHTHNLATNLSGKMEYTYQPMELKVETRSAPTFMGYRRPDGRVGIRNEVWIVNTVGCVNKTAERLAKETGAKCFPHPFGCSQLGDDQQTTQLILRGLVNHPNAGGVLVLGLGCENNNIDVFKTVLGSWDTQRVKFLNTQDVEDEIAEGVRLIRELQAQANADVREEIPLSELVVGLKCGGSDAFSGITANPLVGRFCDSFAAMGGRCVLTEVPEMFGAEHLLMRRCVDEAVFEKTVALINDFKDYYTRHGQVVYENPSPGNKAGGITTLEEKSLGCIRKGGFAPVTDVLTYGDTVQKPGLSLLNGPGNDMVACTNLMAAGCHMILFTTGRGTPLGTGVPTLKIATNPALAAKKPHWIDFDASNGDEEGLLQLVVAVAGGALAKNEQNGYEEISIFKDGVTL